MEIKTSIGQELIFDREEEEYSFLCGHTGAKDALVVRYSAGIILHRICKPCFNSGIYYCQEVQDEGD